MASGRLRGGVRSTGVKNCFSEHLGKYDEYRPLWWYSDADKKDYEEAFGIIHSKCYTEYGLKRTGCAGCPFGRKMDDELVVLETYEPKLFKAVNHIFADSFEYTRQYKEFCKERKKKE